MNDGQSIVTKHIEDGSYMVGIYEATVLLFSVHCNVYNIW